MDANQPNALDNTHGGLGRVLQQHIIWVSSGKMLWTWKCHQPSGLTPLMITASTGDLDPIS